MASLLRTPAEVGRPIRAAGLVAAVEDMPGLVRRLLVPGRSQLHSVQMDRGLVFTGSFVSSFATGLFCWGSWLGWIFLAFAAAWLIVSALDALRQRTFPVFPARVALSSVLVVVGLAFCVPLASALWVFAWPTESDRVSGAAYLVNRRAYVAAAPVQGHWIWIRSSPSRTPRSGLVVAVGGQEVEYTGRRWRVDGKEVHLPFRGPEAEFPGSWRFRVPKDHVLLEPEGRGAPGQASSPLIIVAQDQIVGRAWARYYPLWERSLL